MSVISMEAFSGGLRVLRNYIQNRNNSLASAITNLDLYENFNIDRISVYQKYSNIPGAYLSNSIKLTTKTLFAAKAGYKLLVYRFVGSISTAAAYCDPMPWVIIDPSKDPDNARYLVGLAESDGITKLDKFKDILTGYNLDNINRWKPIMSYSIDRHIIDSSSPKIVFNDNPASVVQVIDYQSINQKVQFVRNGNPWIKYVTVPCGGIEDFMQRCYLEDVRIPGAKMSNKLTDDTFVLNSSDIPDKKGVLLVFFGTPNGSETAPPQVLTWTGADSVDYAPKDTFREPYYKTVFGSVADVYSAMDSLLDTPYGMSKTVLGTVDGLEIREYVFSSNRRYRSLNEATIANRAYQFKRRVAITAGMHGDERLSVLALVEFCRNLCLDSETNKLLGPCDFYVVPVANPYGYNAEQRVTHNGTDLNRDCESMSTPETAIIKAFLDEGYDLYLDCHNTSVGESAHTPDCFGYVSQASGIDAEKELVMNSRISAANHKSERQLATYLSRNTPKPTLGHWIPWKGSTLKTWRNYGATCCDWSLCMETSWACYAISKTDTKFNPESVICAVNHCRNVISEILKVFDSPVTDGRIVSHASGRCAHIPDSANAKLRKLEISDIPSGVLTVQVCGKNLFDPSKVNNLAIAIKIAQSSNYRGYYIPCSPGDVFSISRKSNTNDRFRVVFTATEPASDVALLGSVITADNDSKIENIVVPSNAKYLFVYLSRSADAIPDIQIERNATATAFEPFKMRTISVTTEIPQNADATVIMDGNYTYMQYTNNGSKASKALTALDSDAIRSLRTYHGVTNIIASGATVNADYVADTKNFIENKLAELQALILDK